MVDDPTNPNKFEGVYTIIGIPKPNTYWIRERDTGVEHTVCVDRLKPYLNPDGPSRRITRSSKKKSGDAEPEPTESERCNNKAEPGQDVELPHAQSKLETLLKKQKPGKGPSKKLVAEQQKTLRIPGYGPPDPKTSDPEPPVKRGPGRPRKAKPDFETPALQKLQNQPLAAIDPTLAPAEPEKGTSATDKPAATEGPKVALTPKEKPKKPKTPKKPKAPLRPKPEDEGTSNGTQLLPPLRIESPLNLLADGRTPLYQLQDNLKEVENAIQELEAMIRELDSRSPHYREMAQRIILDQDEFRRLAHELSTAGGISQAERPAGTVSDGKTAEDRRIRSTNTSATSTISTTSTIEPNSRSYRYD
ncbi:proteoglycan 4-like [Paramacrobiotus metropolitanus]|uniref:proteoglycan 4-like n=1 Tax=Paramacrobiotus metropolitanus TaxID=2943436 RepID=UPI0024462BE9|nr:proteoglycan 4-like [Paramacrobiotus metropolitanus]